MERAVIALSRLLLGLAVVVCAACFAWRDAVGEAVLTRALTQRRGLVCNRPRVLVAPSLNHIRLSPLRCQVSEGPVRAFETGVTHLRLRRLSVRTAELEFAVVDYRARELSHLKTSMSAAATRVEQPEELRPLRGVLLRAMLDASEMFSADIPVVRVDTLTAKREGRVQLVMRGFRKSMEDGWDRSRAARVSSPTLASVSLHDFDMWVLPSWAKLSATLSLGPSQRLKVYELRLEGRRLDGERARVVTELASLVRPPTQDP